uniref:Rhodanese domain-containing protein n=1 Tax=Solibacter usitatus (strain Ellin6076) TaxID=234267 RepID=Q023U5_SOLUE
MPNSLRTSGTAAPVLLALALVCWAFALRGVWHWIGLAPVPGRETDKLILQAWSGGWMLLAWILLGGLLLVANAKGVLPVSVGMAAWVMHPVSAVAALIALGIAYDARWRWCVALPAAVPLLIGGYAAWAFAGRAPEKFGLAMWAAVLAMSLTILPGAWQFKSKYMDSGSIDATPGPKLDKWMADQAAKRRAGELAELSKIDDETTLSELEHLTRKDSPVLQEALAAMRGLPHRQAEAVLRLQSDFTFILRLLPDIDVQPTAELCGAIRGYLQRYLRHERANRPEPEGFIGDQLEESVRSLGWISEHCDCEAELDDVERFARAQRDTAEVRAFIAALAEARQKRK